MTLSADPTAYHSSHEPEVASTDLVKLDKASQLVPADVAHCIVFNSTVFAGIPQQALLKAYDEQNSSEVLPPMRKSSLECDNA